MLSRLNLSAKILLTGVAIAIAFPLFLLTWILPRQAAAAYEMKTESTKNVVKIAWGVLDYYGRQAGAGRLTLAEAQALAKSTLRQVRFQNGNYVWLNDMTPVMIMHPTNPALEGKNLSSLHDPDGVALFTAMVHVCAEKGSGAVRYMWPKPGAATPLPKISYVKLYPAWNWVVGAGIYVDDVETTIRQSRNFALMLTALDLAVSLLVFYLMARSLGTPLRRAAAKLTEFTELTTRAVDNVSSASQSIAAGTSEQAASLEETSAAVSELTSHTKRSLDAARDIRDLVSRVGVVVVEGNGQMELMNRAIKQIGDSAEQVRPIVKAIEQIAFQTNILALNAAVEAARAGEAGTGFSVVADEVRNLAQRASDAAHQAAELIGNSLSSSEQGAAISIKLAAAFGTIVDRIQEVNSGLVQMTDSVQAENEGIAQINSAISEISTVTQAQASTSEETASAAEELRAQAGSVRQLSGELRDLVEGISAS